MAYIQTVEIDEATGSLKTLYDEAIKRAGRVYQVVKIQSRNATTLRAGLGMYRAVMYGPSGLSRRQREMVAVVVSRANDCHY